MANDDLAHLHAAYIQDHNDWVAKDREHKDLMDRFYPMTTNPGPANPMRWGEPLTPESMAEIERTDNELEAAFRRHRASTKTYVEAYQRAQRSRR